MSYQIERPCPLLRIIDGEAFCGASRRLEEVFVFENNGRDKFFENNGNKRKTCPNKLIARSFDGKQMIMCCEKTKKPIRIGESLLTYNTYKSALELVSRFSGSSKICPECVFRVIIGFYDYNFPHQF